MERFMTFDTAMTLLRQVLVILGAALMSAAGGAGDVMAAHNVVIVATGSSSNGSWAGDTWTANADDATLLASEIETHLASGPTVVSTGGGGTQEGNILVVGGVSWSANRLTLSAANDVTIDAPLTGTGIVALALEYGQGAAAEGNPALYRINVPVKFGAFPSTDRTPHMITKRGSDGVPVARAVPACSGRPGGCPFLKLSPATIDIWYSSTEVDVAADSTHWLYLDWRKDFESQFPYVMGCVQGEGVFYYPRNQEQRNYYDLTGAITDLPGLERTTTTTRFCKDFNDGPILSLLSAQDFPYGYYIRYQPTPGESGRQYNTLSILVTEESEANASYRVYDYLVNVRPAGEFPATVDLPPSGHALDFDGIDDYVTIPDADALDLTASYTLEAWIKPDEFTWLGGLISKYTTWGAGGFTLRLGMNGSFSGINFDGMETAEGVLRPGRWQHVAAVNDGGTRHVYVDGVEQPLAGTPITPVANGGPVAIGMDWDGRYFNGAFDEVRVWSTARSPAEIVAAMAGPVPADAAGLAACYRLDQGVAEGDNAGVTTVDDGTANNHDGTLFNFGLNETVSNWVGLLVHGFCGGDHGGHPPATPARLCATGVASAVSGTGPWSWSCWGQHGGTSAQCSAYVWTVTPLSSAGGTITPNVPQPAPHGATVSFTITPDPGNAIDLIEGCGGAMSDADTYTSGPITGDCTVTVAFQPAQAITVTQSAPATAVYAATFDVAASASSGLPVAISTSGACSGGGAGKATITVTSGTGTCTVRYNQAGDATYAPAPEVTATVDLQKAGTLTTVTSHLPAPSAAGESVVVAFSVTSPQGSPAGDVSVSDGVDGCTAAVSAGSCTLTLSSVGGRSLTATYAGNADFGGSASGAASHEVLSGYDLTAGKTGSGTGTITSLPSGIDCGSDCSETFGYAAVVTLLPAPADGSGFSGWSGDADCSDGVVTMNAPRSCTATFDLCAYGVSPGSAVFSGVGGTGSVAVSAPEGCRWTAESSDGWISITSGSSGAGDGTLTYAVSFHSGPGPRNGSITIAGVTVDVSQSPDFSSYVDHFDDRRYRDQWQAIRQGWGGLNEHDSVLDLTIARPAAGCAYTNLVSRERFGGGNLVAETGVRLRGRGEMILRLAKDDDTYVQFGVREFAGGLPVIIFGSAEAGAYAEQVLDGAAAFAARSGFKTFSILKEGDEYRAYLNGRDAGGGARNSLLGDTGLRIELRNRICATGWRGARNLFDYVFVTETVDGRQPAETLRLLVPSAGKGVYAGTVNPIIWEGPAGASSYSIHRRTDGGGPWIPLAVGTEGNFHAWKIPRSEAGAIYRLKVTAYDGQGNVLSVDRSDGSVRVLPPPD